MDPPLIDQIRPFFNPSKRHLTHEETSSAARIKLIPFPEVIRSVNDPQVDTDTYVLLSFLKSTEHSYVKVRGFGNLESCKEKAKQIIKSVDSRIPIALARVGQWCYVTSDPAKHSKETVKIIDDKEITHKEHVELLISEHLKKEQESESKEDSIDTPVSNDLHNYIREKVMLYETHKQIQFLKTKLDLLVERQSLLATINKKCSEKYENCWYAEYMKQLSVVGIKTTHITEDKISELEKEISLVEDEPDLKKKLKQNEDKYNGLRYAAVDF